MKSITFIAIVLILAVSVPDLSLSQQPLLSPRDSVEISFNGKKISVNFGKPSMRGRKIMGGVVPFDKWWRTGANEATAFVTQADLIVGGKNIPKGSYTLYTMPSAKQWKLIINKQTGQWGTVYSPKLDLVRIPLKKKMLKTPVDTLSIILEKTGKSSGMLRLVWENTDLSVSVQIKKEPNASSH
jgi:hypothetical protein